ncbi:chymotrypsin-like elastase family member 1 [Pecten maximus]|uniref:chymotrypsin-like elastase family member 1 n=1 Tax=Pecten maximus TaxID=6579 RepID=UPI0014588459|nr:chymotrypsin-like elastase family member 1 [Pecten maximus]
MDTQLVLLVLVICGFAVGLKLPVEDEDNGLGMPPAIVGGTDAAEDAWPWQVNLLYRGIFWCGGTLLNDDTVLTAAQCTCLCKKRQLRVVVGDYDRKKNEKMERCEKKIKVKKIIEHPDYDGDVLHDLAIIKLKKKVTFNDYIQPIPWTGERHHGLDEQYLLCYWMGSR